MGYSSWGRKESDTTERLTHTHTHTHSSVHRILQARILAWVAISFSRGSSRSDGKECRWILYPHREVSKAPLVHFWIKAKNCSTSVLLAFGAVLCIVGY